MAGDSRKQRGGIVKGDTPLTVIRSGGVYAARTKISVKSADD